MLDRTGIGTILCACVVPEARQLVVEQFDPIVLLVFVPLASHS